MDIPTTILVAPDSFKGTFTAVEVTEAIARGLQRAGRPTDLCPVADGGEGTLAALTGTRTPSHLAELRAATVHDPLERPIEATFALIEGGATAIIETASASGLHLVAEHERDPVACSTRGTGELILAAIEAGVKKILLGVGGSATTDGGAGAIAALHAAGARGLQASGARLTVLCDVQTPFEDAARVFAPQKGADPAAVKKLTRRLHEQAGSLPRDPRGVPMTGAAGGLSGGLWAAFGAELVPGAAFVLDALGFDARMRAARAVVTGEGRLDRQSLAGKAIAEVATRARQSGVPCHAIVGERHLDAFGARVLDLQAILEATTLADLEAAGERLAELL